MPIELLTPASGARLLLLTGPQRLFIEQNAPLMGNGGAAVDFLHPSLSGQADASQGVGLTLQWRGTTGRCRVSLRCPAEERIIETLGSSLTIYNLRIGMRYDWTVSCAEETAAGWFETEDRPPRIMRVDGATNVRDIGGWRTENGRRIRQGMIFRGSELDRHLQITSHGINALLHQLRVKTDLDFRIEADRPALAERRMRWLHLPIGAYEEISDPEQQTAYAQAFRALLNPDYYPIYAHCWGGADRTGCFFYLLGALLGMSQADLLLDYELTSLSIWGDRWRDSESFQRFMTALDDFAPSLASPRERAERYWQSAGITQQEMRAMQEMLLEDQRA